MKICSLCKIVKCYCDFTKDKNRRDGFSYVCKLCRYDKAKELHSRNLNKLATAKYRASEHGKQLLRQIHQQYKRSERGRLLSQQYVRRRRELKRHIDMNYSAIDERMTRILFGNLCFKCESKNDLQIDHHYPLSKGFGLSLDNAVLLCGYCNNSKNDSLPEKFYSQEQFERLNYLLALATI